MTPSALSLLAALAVSLSPLPPGDHVRTIFRDGIDRSYTIHVPPSYTPDQPAPVVLTLHSAAMNAASFARFCGINAKSDQAGFLVVYPIGTGTTPMFRYWDSGGVKGRPSDDVGYIVQVLDDLATVATIDPKRVYATGMSNGAMMCHRLAAELSDRIAAIAPVAGSLALESIRPARPVPVLHLHGTLDRMVLYNGPNEHIPKNLRFLSVDESIRAWVKANGCPPTPSVAILPDLDGDGLTVRRETYGPAKNGCEVVLYSIEGCGHTWPGREPPVKVLGKSTHDFSANDVIWEFFQRHPMP
jgi:polyhydroxybutyrate depolymerase